MQTETKSCQICKTTKPLVEYYVRRAAKDGRSRFCIPCAKEKAKVEQQLYKERIQLTRKFSYEKNKEIVKQNSLDYYKNHRERRIQQMRQYNTSNKEKTRERMRKYLRVYEPSRYKTDVQYRLKKSLRKRIWTAINHNQKVGSAVKELGCTVQFLKQYLEAKFQPGMTWDNWSKTGWHIDHIRPLASFDLTDVEQFRAACHYTNLQPLWAKDNLRKSDKFVEAGV